MGDGFELLDELGRSEGPRDTCVRDGCEKKGLLEGRPGIVKRNVFGGYGRDAMLREIERSVTMPLALITDPSSNSLFIISLIPLYLHYASCNIAQLFR